jgi:carbamate kinase
MDRGVVPPLVVVALGGNAIQEPEGDDSVESDFERTSLTAAALVRFALSGPFRLVVTHGNGPQVGNHLLRSELGKEHGDLPLLPLEVCVADTQGGMGYMIQQSLANEFHAAGVPVVVVSVVSQVVVDRDDQAFANPSKPVGEMIPPDRVADSREHGWTLEEDTRRGGFRRVVASPDPIEIVEAAAIKALVEDGLVVVAAGGGGVPVVQTSDGSLQGCPAVVDKDLASALLAADLQADAFVILTDVPKVYSAYGTDSQKAIDEMSVADVKRMLAAGEFPSGSMGPKVEAMRRFVSTSRRVGIIASIDEAEDALDGHTGTRIVP